MTAASDRPSTAITYTDDTSTTHIGLGRQMDYDLHRWACQTWGQYGPTAVARALVLNDTIGEAKAWIDREHDGSESAP